MANIFLRAGILMLALAFSACAPDGVAGDKTTDEKDDKAKAEAAIPVEVAQPVRGEMLAMYSGTATLEAEADAEVIAKVGGEVRRLFVEEGDHVRAGQVLAQLDDRQLRLQAAQTRAARAKAERDFNRQVELHEKGLVSAGAFEGLKYDLDNQVAADDIAQLNLSYSRCAHLSPASSPFDTSSWARRSRSAPACFRISDPTPLKANVFVPERELARLKPGQLASINVDALAGRSFPATVKLVSPVVDAATATFKVTLEVNDPKGDLKPGMFARVGIVFERRTDALTIPRVALLDTDGSSNVFVVTAGKAEQRAIKTGLNNAGRIEIIEGLKGNEQVVVVGQNGLKDGNPVRVVSLDQTQEELVRDTRGFRDSPARHHRHGDGGGHAARFHFPVAAQGQPAPRSFLPDADHSHRAAGRGAHRGGKPDLAPGGGSRRRGAQRPFGAFGVALRPVRRDHRVHLGHRHGLRGHRSPRTPGHPVAARRGHAPTAAALRSIERAGDAGRVRRRGQHQPNAAASSEERLKFLRRFADDRIKPEIESVEGSAAVKVSGGYEDEVQIYVDQQRLAQLRLSIEQVALRIGAENVNLSGGRLEQGTQRFLVRTVNEFDTLEDMANSVIATVDGQPVYLKDVARVERGYKDRTAITRLNGAECIELAIYKEGDANTVQMAQGIAAKLEALGKTLPAGTRLTPVYDQSKFIASAVSDVKDAAILGGLLSILVLYFFLRDAWATIVTGVVIPVTVVGIFVMMYAFDLTLNVMSLGGIALSVGMLIDNSVVILEAIARRKEAGLSTIDAAREGTAEVATAVTASTLTSVAVFFPMVFVSGIAGQLFRDQALTVTFAQLISLMVGITLVPMLTAWRARLGEPKRIPRPMPANRARHWLRCATICGRYARTCRCNTSCGCPRTRAACCARYGAGSRMDCDSP